MSDESTRAQGRTESGHRPQDEEAPDRRWRDLARSVRALAVSFGPSVVLDLLLATSVAATASGALPDPYPGLECMPTSASGDFGKPGRASGGLAE